MNFLFFDAESIHKKHKYSYTFAYVSTDENFNVIKSEDIVFNPDLTEDEYDWRVVRTMMEPSYYLKDVNKKSKFTSFYTKIKRLVGGENTLCIGFQTESDVKYLLGNCFRYNLDSINFKYVDIRDIIAELTHEKVNGLAIEYVKWVHKTPELSHTSVIDAMMTCDVLKNVLTKYKVDLKDFLQIHSNMMYEVKDYCYISNGETRDVRINYPSTHVKINGVRYHNPQGKKKDWIVTFSVNLLLFERYIKFVEIKNNTESLFQNKKVSISSNYENYNYKNMVKIVKLLADMGATYTRGISKADILITYDSVVDEEGKIMPCSKWNYVKNLKNDAKIDVMSFDEFLKCLNINRKELDNMEDVDLEYLKDEKYSKM